MRLFVFFVRSCPYKTVCPRKTLPLCPLGLFRFPAAVLGRALDRSGFRERICHCGIALIMAQGCQSPGGLFSTKKKKTEKKKGNI